MVRLILDNRNKLFTTRVEKHWHRLLRAAADAPSFVVLEAKLDGFLGNWVWWEVSQQRVGIR